MKEKEQLIIIGTSTTAKQVYDFVQEYELYDIIGFAVDDKFKNTENFCGLPVFEVERLPSIISIDKVKIFVAMLWNNLNADRRNMYERLKGRGFQFANLISPCSKMRGKLLGGNCWIHDYVIVQSSAEIGENCMVMAFSLIGAFAKLGSHCFMGTKSTLAGECNVGEQTFIGMNCTVFDNTKIGKKCILGACTAIKRNMEDYCVIKTITNNVVVEKWDEISIEEKLVFKKNVR